MAHVSNILLMVDRYFQLVLVLWITKRQRPEGSKRKARRAWCTDSYGIIEHMLLDAYIRCRAITMQRALSACLFDFGSRRWYCLMGSRRGRKRDILLFRAQVSITFGHSAHVVIVWGQFFASQTRHMLLWTFYTLQAFSHEPPVVRRPPWLKSFT